VIECTPFLGDGKIPYQELHIFVNFLRVGFEVLNRPEEINVRIPKQVFSSSQLVIDFYLPKAASPASIGAGTDQRVLGIAIHRMMMAELEEHVVTKLQRQGV
jgi:hypothetical protein